MNERSVLLLLALSVAGCDDARPGADAGSASSDAGFVSGAPSNQARFRLDCDLGGVTGALTLDVEAVGASGIVFGSGSSPDITGVIGTGDVTYYTSGEVRSPVAHYVFTGANQFADFTETATFERFRVQWVPTAEGLDMVVNPFGPGPTQHSCVLTDARYL